MIYFIREDIIVITIFIIHAHTRFKCVTLILNNFKPLSSLRLFLNCSFPLQFLSHQFTYFRVPRRNIRCVVLRCFVVAVVVCLKQLFVFRKFIDECDLSIGNIVFP